MSLSTLKTRQGRNALSLKKKVEVIKAAKNNPQFSVRRLADLFECGKTQISSLLKNKESILELYETNAASESVSSRKRVRSCEFSDINEALHKWYLLACSKNIYPVGPQLCEKAKEIAERLQQSSFKASNGWLDRWKKRYNITHVKINGESGEVSGVTVESWKERVPELLQKYASENIWNLDETGCFWRALPDHGFGKKGSQCKGGKKAKQRVTVALIANAAGGKEAAIVVWKSAKPRCFKGIDATSLPVHYYSQPKAWMTGAILESVLSKLNRRLSARGRKIALLMDNAGCHPEDLKDRFSNIRIIFLPPNTTSMLQPLDLGIIQNFKVHYRTLFLRFVLSKIDACETASEITKSVSILHAIRWIAQAWEAVRPEVVKKCFRKAGILDESFSVVSRSCEDRDPFEDIDVSADTHEIEALICQLGPSDASCSVTEFVSGDDDLPVCFELDDSQWEEQFFSSIDPSTTSTCTESEPEKDELDLEPPAPKLRNLGEAIRHLEDVQVFLDSRGYVNEATIIASAVDTVASLHCKTGRQSTLDEYLTPP